LGQPPALGQAWHFEAAAGGSLTTAEKLENCFSTFFSPHSGHAGPLLLADLTSASFTNPHFVHLYSKIGILYSHNLFRRFKNVIGKAIVTDDAFYQIL
jgi:hypothetical protein